MVLPLLLPQRALEFLLELTEGLSDLGLLKEGPGEDLLVDPLEGLLGPELLQVDLRVGLLVDPLEGLLDLALQ